MTVKKRTFWNTPYPVSIMNAFKTLLPKNREEKKPRSPRGVRRMLGVFAAVSLILVWILEGFVNPLEYLVDLPAFSYEEMEGVYAGYDAFYYLWLLAVTAAMMTLLKQFICNGKEFPIWTVNGILFWIVGLAVALLADVVTRNIVMERFVIPAMENADTSLTNARIMILSLFLVHFSAYFVVEDLSGNCMSALLTPYVLSAYDTYFAAGGLMRVQLVKFLVLTLMLKLLLIVLDKLGVTGFLSDLMIKYAYTPKYIPFVFLLVLAAPFLPFMYIGYLIKKGKNKNNEETYSG